MSKWLSCFDKFNDLPQGTCIHKKIGVPTIFWAFQRARGHLTRFKKVGRICVYTISKLVSPTTLSLKVAFWVSDTFGIPCTDEILVNLCFAGPNFVLDIRQSYTGCDSYFSVSFSLYKPQHSISQDYRSNKSYEVTSYECTHINQSTVLEVHPSSYLAVYPLPTLFFTLTNLPIEGHWGRKF